MELNNDRSMKTLILVRGLPGSGKSSFANYMFSNNVFETDQYFYDSDGNYNFDASKLNIAHIDCQNRVESMMANRINQHNSEIVVANTFTQNWEMQPYFNLAEKYEYNVVSLIVENYHNSKSIHNVPDETIEKMKNRFEIRL